MQDRIGKMGVMVSLGLTPLEAARVGAGGRARADQVAPTRQASDNFSHALRRSAAPLDLEPRSGATP